MSTEVGLCCVGRWTLQLLLAASVLQGFIRSTPAADFVVQRGAVLANTCAACHGPNGRSTGAIPSLIAVPAQQLRATLLAYRHGERPATVMHRVTQGLDDADIDALVAYFARKR